MILFSGLPLFRPWLRLTLLKRSQLPPGRLGEIWLPTLFDCNLLSFYKVDKPRRWMAWIRDKARTGKTKRKEEYNLIISYIAFESFCIILTAPKYRPYILHPFLSQGVKCTRLKTFFLGEYWGCLFCWVTNPHCFEIGRQHTNTDVMLRALFLMRRILLQQGLFIFSYMCRSSPAVAGLQSPEHEVFRVVRWIFICRSEMRVPFDKREMFAGVLRSRSASLRPYTDLQVVYCVYCEHTRAVYAMIFMPTACLIPRFASYC